MINVTSFIPGRQEKHVLELKGELPASLCDAFRSCRIAHEEVVKLLKSLEADLLNSALAHLKSSPSPMQVKLAVKQLIFGKKYTFRDDFSGFIAFECQGTRLREHRHIEQCDKLQTAFDLLQSEADRFLKEDPLGQQISRDFQCVPLWQASLTEDILKSRGPTAKAYVFSILNEQV